MKADQHVQVIFHSSDPIEMALTIFQHPPDETKQLLTTSLVEDSLAIFGRKDNVVKNLGVGSHVPSDIRNDTPVFKGQSVLGGPTPLERFRPVRATS